MEFKFKSKFTIILLVPFISLLLAFELPNNDTFYKWNRVLEFKLHDFLTTVTQVDFAKSVYKYDAGIVSIQKINGHAILKSVLEKLNTLLTNKKSALKKLVDKAENAYASLRKDDKPSLTLEDLSFFNMKTLQKKTKMSFDGNFRQAVSFDESGVHIPLEIFDGYPEVLSGLNWTASLDEVFKENYRNNPDLRWQYFGSFFGFMRVYPALRWPDHPSLPDLFDVRRRSWYIQGSVTPKDVIILIDRSGSVHGPTLDIMKITARALLNSLGENDYVNVAWFNNRVKWVVPCLTTLVQATAQIKRLLGDAVERLTESNLTSYNAALEFAFEEFKKFDNLKKPWMGSNCHKIVMFLSDGGTEWPTDLMTRHCNESQNGHIKIFTFACGPHPIPTVVLKEMACSTGGYFSPVTALGSVRVKIRDYIKVLSRPLAYSKDDNMYQWHNFYRDVGGLGTVTTVTLPVFNKNPEKQSKSTHLLGVMGIDIPVKEMIDLFPKHLLGPFGYPFAINTNGFVIFHPRLYDHIVYIEDPPNIYLTDLEGNSIRIKEMEKLIIDGSNGSLKYFQSIVPIGIGNAVVVNMDYFYGALESSTFRFGIALPSEHTLVNVKMSNVSDYLSNLSALGGSYLAPWDFCSNGDDEMTPEKLVQLIADNYTSCDHRLIKHLLWDAGNLVKISEHWKQNFGEGALSRFMITSSGLSINHVPQGHQEYTRQKDPLKNNLYKKASTKSAFFFSMSNENWNTITVATRITLNESFVTAVMGAVVQQQSIQQIFEETLNSDSDGGCQSPDLLNCYLLNDGGIITASNVKSSSPGDFIGLHDPDLLEVLISKKILQREFRYNYQSWCSRDLHQIQAGAPSRHFPQILKLIYEAVAAFHWNFLYTAFLYLIASISDAKKPATADNILESENQSCVTRSAWYYHGGPLAGSGAVKCGSRTRTFQVSFLPKVMLLFVIIQPPCTESQYLSPVTFDAIQDTEFHHCLNQEHYRLRPDKCYSETPKEFAPDCGATSKGHANTSTTFIQMLSLILLFTPKAVKSL